MCHHLVGVAEDADECFSEATALRLQQEHASTSALEKSNFANENRILSSSLPSSLGDIIPKQMKQLHANNAAEVPGYPHVRATALHVQNSTPSNIAQFDNPSPIASQTSSIVPPPLFRNVHAYQNTISGDAPAKQKANGANQPLRRKYLDEARLKKVSGRLFNQSSDSMPRRSARLSRDTTINSNSNSNISQFGGNGTDHSSGKLRVNSSTPSKLCSTAVRSMQVRKGKPRATENFDEGSRYEVIDEMWTDNVPAPSSSVSTTEGRFFEQDKAERIMSQDSKVAIGIRELLGLLRTLGEGFRLSCLFKCQEALEVFRKLPESQFNTGWVLCQVQRMHDEWRHTKMLLILVVEKKSL
jgi:anaphase-promoting complex subunit 3